jgi:enoyl-CoA hydratase/carnithine racemase
MADIVYTKDGAVASLRFNRPEKRNAISGMMYHALSDALDDAAADGAIRVAGIFGGEVFTAGNDIGDFLAAGVRSEGIPAIRFLKTLAAFPKPVIAGVKGAAVGIGTTLLLHCDAVVAGRSARFTLPFTRLGLVPEGASSLLLPLVAGRMRASWLLLSGQQFGAEEAERFGLATRVTEDTDVDAAVALMCGELAELPADAIQTTKGLIKARTRDVVEASIDEEAGAFIKALKTDEAREALTRFVQRR